MIITIHPPTIVIRARAPFWSKLLAVASARLKEAGRRAAVRRARRELLELSDTMLADIGISRSDITSVTALGSADLTRHPRRSA
jgi:uncharacterized protein YjiS (DUF1127 family)